ncbi:zinc carboxypeptidase-like [Eupeodes corollae]|uniref:zinc carboxypeptidase-like n=1 Tax=Eupeodes corollae TaxID=290404 RepID=UPI002491F501|nr:zinc carboxypeptidase-like [Eupeodes corollae]XP_055908367.1 zinc carboxypeptidase-like [Eupeodes corollae]
MNITLHILTYFALIAACFGASFCTKDDKCDEPIVDAARYDNYRMYYVDIDTSKHVEVLQKFEELSDSCIFMGHARNPGQKLSILVAAHKVADFVDLLKTYEMKYKVLSYNFQEKIDKNLKEVLPKGVKVDKFDWNHYFHLETIYEWLEKLSKDYEEVTLLDMGSSTQGIPMKGVKIARNPNNKAIFIESGIHAREWIAPATATYIIDQLLTSKNPEIQKLADNYNWIVFPSVNPDGYKYSFESDRMWRKNRQLFGICRGVDLNRNYPFHWNETGSSPDPCRYDYAGPSGASEIETQRLIEFVKNNAHSEVIKTYIALHSYSQLIMFPYGFTPERVSNYDDLKAIGEKASEAIKQTHGKIYKSGSLYETIYPSSGGSKDWAHATMNIPITFTFELRGPPDSSDMFILPAEQILPTGEEAFAAIRTIVNEAAARGYYTK